MGAGRGISHRVKVVNTKVRVKQKPKPKFNIGDEVDSDNVKFVGRVPAHVYSIMFNDKKNSYRYNLRDAFSLGKDVLTLDEDDMTLVKSPLNNKRWEDCRDCLHSIVIFQYRSNKWHGQVQSEVKKYDGKKGCIVSISKIPRNGKAGFSIHFDGDDEKSRFSFREEDFELVEQKIDAEELKTPLDF